MLRSRKKGLQLGTHRPPIRKSGRSVPRRYPWSTSNALTLWEDWKRARPFTSGKRFFNVGVSHDVAFAADRFGSVGKIPKDFDAWEELARRVEGNYVRGWVAKDGSRMFLWDDFSDVLAGRSEQFDYLADALVKLRRKGFARPRTELWDMGGARHVGKLGDLRLLVDRSSGLDTKHCIDTKI